LNLEITDEYVQTLVRLGLTNCQAKAYLAIIKSDMSTAKTISKITNIARPDIYRVIAELETLGLVEKSIGKPTKLQALSIYDGISLLLKSRKQETSKIIAGAKKMYQDSLKTNKKISFQEDNPQFVLIAGKDAAIRKRREEIEKAQLSIDFVSSWKRFPRTVDTFGENTKKALDRNVKMRVILEKPPEGTMLPKLVEKFKKYSNYELRYVIDPPSGIIGIFDNKRVLIITSSIDLEEVSCLWSNNPCLISIIKDFFEILWAKQSK
jgi:sugar-specific transcriptional regulator TrmB